MPRYTTRRAFADDYYPEPPFITSIDAWERDPVNTGLLDSEGNAIYRMNDPVGFRFD